MRRIMLLYFCLRQPSLDSLRPYPLHVHKWTVLITVAYCPLIGFVLLSPSADLPSTVVLETSRHLVAAGAPDATTVPYRLEFVLNALMVSPIIVAGRLRFSGTSWRDWTAWTFVAAATIESFQGLALAGRSATFVDVVANTTGALAGTLVVSGMRVLRQVTAAHAAQSAA